MGWSHWAALIVAGVGAAGLAALFGAFFVIAFMLGVGLPAWWLGYLALLARPAADGALEWYPVGHLVFWAAMLAAAVVIAGMLTLGSDLDTFRASLRSGLERSLNLPAGEPQSRVLDVLVAVLPAAAAVLATATNVVNLWLAERVVKVSGRLPRPASDLSAMRLPRYAPALAGLAIAASFLPGMLGVSAGVLAASLSIAYAIVGFAVLHMITRGMGSRPFTLGSTYVAVLILGWPVLVMSLLGLADTAFDLRGRGGRRHGPSDPRA
jgi:hypothetical protein